MENKAEKNVEEISVMCDEDVILARQRVRSQAQEMGFSPLNQTRFVTAVSELARNIVVHAREGKISVFKATAGDKTGLKVVFEDKGPGIPDIKMAMEEGFSTIGSMGIGLKGAKRLVDEFDIKSSPGKGTIVTITKWL